MPNPVSPITPSEAEERVRRDAADFMRHSTDDTCRRMCQVGFREMTILLAHYDHLKRSFEASRVSLPSEHEGLVGELRRISACLRKVASSSKPAPGEHRLKLPDGSYATGPAVDLIVELLSAFEVAADGIDQALTARGGDEGNQGLTTSRARPEGDVLAGKEG